MKPVFHAIALSSLIFVAADGRTAVSDDAASRRIDAIPHVVAALEQGLAAERGFNGKANFPLAIRFYCDAVAMGSPEGFYRIGLILANGPPRLRDRQMGNTYFAWSSLLGHPDASRHHDKNLQSTPMGKCEHITARWKIKSIRINPYLASQPAERRKIAEYIRQTAPQFGINPRLALGIALAESNLNPRAVSPKNAQGVMQLMPATQQRFGVTKPFDPVHSVRGGLAYLSFLQKQFGGNWALMAAAYNAGEQSVRRHGGIPPYPETKLYVRRVLYFAHSR